MRNEKIYDAYEIACLMDTKRLCSDLLSSLLRLNSVTNAHYVNNDIYDKSQAARKAVEDLAIELGISLCNTEDGRQQRIIYAKHLCCRIQQPWNGS